MIYRSTIKGGPAGDVGLAALAHVIRYVYVKGSHLPARTPEDEHVELELFAAFLAGRSRP